MWYLRSFLAAVLSISLAGFEFPAGRAAHPPIGILTLANRAYLNEAAAFPGLSVFEGEVLSTGPGGQMGIRAGHSTLTLAAKTEATLVSIPGGVHVDLSAGSIHFSSEQNEWVEVHAEEALLRPESNQPTQASVSILVPKVLQITTKHGGLTFSYRQEFRNLPEGETYRIYLDAPGEAGSDAGVSVQKAGIPGKVAYFIVGAGVAGVAAWGVREALSPGNNPISPAKP